MSKRCQIHLIVAYWVRQWTNQRKNKLNQWTNDLTNILQNFREPPPPVEISSTSSCFASLMLASISLYKEDIFPRIHASRSLSLYFPWSLMARLGHTFTVNNLEHGLCFLIKSAITSLKCRGRLKPTSLSTLWVLTTMCSCTIPHSPDSLLIPF